MSKKEEKRKGDKIPYKSHNYITRQDSFLQLDLKLGSFVGWVICLRDSCSFFTFGGSLSRQYSWSQVLLEALGSCSYLWNNCSLVRGYFLGTSVSFVSPCWLGRGGSWGCTSLFGSTVVEATSSWIEGKTKAHIAEG